MTDSEIVKAFECCYFGKDICEECPCFKGEKCTSFEVAYDIPNRILDLINRQKAEIERLELLIQSLNIVISKSQNDCEAIEAEAVKEFAERLKEENNLFADVGKMHSEVKAEAVKEFERKIRLRLFDDFNINTENYIKISNHIEAVFEEMVGE